MSVKEYCINTDSSKYYYIITNKKGENLLIQADRYRQFGESEISGQWRCMGFREVLPFNNLGRLITPDEMIKLVEENTYSAMRFKNGNGKYRLVDCDHGTYRVWEDKINSMWEVKN